ncbi:MAG TPA: GNAT family N-acetyltransferase [Kofleriaceae bacterium]|nr:GNAT family N-acetyltransferase [Kofleriaceae bacterium]
MAPTLAELTRADLAAATDVLAAACGHDRAAAVAEEKLFGPSPRGTPVAFGARLGGFLMGVAVACGDRIRVIAVHPAARGQGLGTQLLAACETAIWRTAARRARTLDEPGNYLAPGIDEDNHECVRWFERRGYVRRDQHESLVVDVRTNPKVSAARAGELAERALARGYQIRRARRDEAEDISTAVSIGFGGAWPLEVERALAFDPPGVHVAMRDGRIAAFAAHDGNNQGLGWFGPSGTWPEHRGQGLGEALLVACLVDIAERHPVAEVAWIGPREFYERAVGTVGCRKFAVLTRDHPSRKNTIPPPIPT